MKQLCVMTPLGAVTLCEAAGALCAVRFDPQASPGGEKTPLLCAAQEQILAYFSGERRSFSLPLSADGTAFERSVWRALTQIGYGKTVSYGELAAMIGKPGAARAVGRACGKNPLLIVIPCHRVIGSGGQIAGYAGGVQRKRALLDLERRCAQP